MPIIMSLRLQLYSNAAVGLERMKEHEEALKIYAHAIKVANNNPDAMLALRSSYATTMAAIANEHFTAHRFHHTNFVTDNNEKLDFT